MLAEEAAIALVNYSAREVTAKVVYYGPGLCGKTTNLEMIHKMSDPATRGRLLSLATQTDRTLFFDLLPLELREVKGVKIRLQLYTVPGQVFYNETRKLVLKNADAVVLVLDSQSAMREKNIESMNNLFENVRELGMEVQNMPIILQYNKRDLKEIMSVEEMDRTLNTRNWPRIEAAAVKGDGVTQTLKVVTKLLYEHLRKNYFQEAGAPGELQLRDARAPRPKPGAPPAAEAPATTAQAQEAAPAPAEPTEAALPSSLLSETLVAVDRLIKENLQHFRDGLGVAFLETAPGLLNDLNVTSNKVFEESIKAREDIAAIRQLLDELAEAARTPKDSEKRSLLGGLWTKKDG